MNVRAQLVANSPLHAVPSIILNIHKTQFIFNVIPTLLRHRANHRINLYNSCHIFFTKNSIEAFGGLPNYLLFRSGAQRSNAVSANKINIFIDRHVYAYMQKLRFKLGHKILRISYCDWMGKLFRFGIMKFELIDKLRARPQFPQIFVSIEQYLKKNYTLNIDYFNSSKYLANNVSKYITIKCYHYSSDLVDIYPIITSSDDTIFTHYICMPAQMIKGKDVNIEQLKIKGGITKQQDIKKFIKQGFLKKNFKTIRKEQYLFRQNYKPKNILILHHTTIQSLEQLAKNEVMLNYFQNNNQTALVIHILQDVNLINATSFQSFINRFEMSTNHLWYNRQFNITQAFDSTITQESHLIELKLYSVTFPSIFRDLQLQRLSYYQNERHKMISSAFPLFKNHFFRRMYNFIKNDYKGDVYQQKLLPIAQLSKFDILKQFFLQETKTIQQIQKRCGIQSNKDNQLGKAIFLGTSSSMPTANRNTLGILVSLCNKVNFLLDCGEGSYEQMIDHFAADTFQQQLIKLRVIFITHIHADHNLGILNLIHERNKLLKKYSLTEKVFLIIPFNVYNWYIQYCNTVEKLADGCDVIFTQVLLNELDEPIQQKVPVSQGSIRYKTGKEQMYCSKNGLLPEYYEQFESSAKTKELVTLQMPFQALKLQIFQLFLKQYSYSQFLPVRVIHCPQSFGVVVSHQNGSKISYSGDTRPSKQFIKRANKSTLMIHEATFNDNEYQDASDFLHCTVQQAVKVGYESKSTMLAVTHFNQRFKDPISRANYTTQIQNYFNKNTIFSIDHLQIPLNKMDYLPLVTHFITKLDAKAKIKEQQMKNQRLPQIQSQD